MKKILFILFSIILLTACATETTNTTPPPEQFHWVGTVKVDTVDLIDESDETPFITDFEDQLPLECQREYIYYRDDISIDPNWHNWNSNTPQLFTLDTGIKSFPGVEVYVTPVLFKNQVEPQVITFTEHPELRQAAMDEMLQNKYWGIIIELDLPTSNQLTGQLPLYLEIPAECWAGSYGG
jgi:hypothetical protein